MCAYSFPEHIPQSDNSKDLMSRIFNQDPSKRPNLEEICNHPFINDGANLPKYLPLSTLACPPSGTYLKQYSVGNQLPSVKEIQVIVLKIRINRGMDHK